MRDADCVRGDPVDDPEVIRLGPQVGYQENRSDIVRLLVSDAVRGSGFLHRVIVAFATRRRYSGNLLPELISMAHRFIDSSDLRDINHEAHTDSPLLSRQLSGRGRAGAIRPARQPPATIVERSNSASTKSRRRRFFASTVWKSRSRSPRWNCSATGGTSSSA